jgi:hypothetical protein
MTTYYDTGTASVVNGATTITFGGALMGTVEAPNFKPGDLFMDPAQPLVPPQRIASVDVGAATAELAVNWPGTTMTSDPYEVRFVDDIARSTAQTRRYLELLGQLAALGIQPNAFGEFADRDTYDDAAEGFIFLSLDGDGVTGDWTLYIKLSGDSADWDDGQSMTGAPGPEGDIGPTGRAAGLYYRYDSATSGDPGSGKLGFNTLTIASAVTLRISKTDADSNAVAAYLATLDDSTNSGSKGQLTFRKVGVPSVFAVFSITGTITDNGTYDSFTVAHASSGGAFVDEDMFTVEFSRTGNNGIAGADGNDGTDGTDGADGDDGAPGADGTDPGILLTWDDGTADANPGAGNLRGDNASLAAAAFLYISKTNRAGDDIAAFLAALADSSSASKGTLILTRSGGNAQASFEVGAVTDATGYVKLAVSAHAGATGFIDGNPISFQFSRSGDAGSGAVDSVNGQSGSVTLETDDISDAGQTNKWATAAEKAKLGHLTVTQAVDLDAIEARVNALDAAVILKGTWDASAGTFPGSGSAQAGESWIVSVAGTVNSIAFAIGDRIIAITDNASTSTFASNWFKADYTDQVLTVSGKTGNVTLQVADITDMSANGRSLVSAADYAAMRTLLGLVLGTNVQAFDADLTALGGLGSTGIAVRTAANTWAQRSIAVTASTGLSITNGDGVGGNPTIAGVDASTTVKGVAEIATGSEYRTGTDTARVLGVAEVWGAAQDVLVTSTSNVTTVNLASMLSCAHLVLGENSTLDFTNLKEGQYFTIEVTATSSTRTLTMDSIAKMWDGVEAGPYSITTSQTLFVCGFVPDGAARVEITAIGRRAT